MKDERSVYQQEKYLQWMRQHLGTTDQAEAVEYIRSQRPDLITSQIDAETWYASSNNDDMFRAKGSTESEAIINAEYQAYWESWSDANEWWD